MVDDLIHREYVRDGELAIHLLDYFLNGKGEVLGIAGGADDEGGAALNPGIDWEIHRRVRRFRQLVSGVAHDADDFVTPPAKTDQVLADRVLIWKILSCELSADDGLVGVIETLVGTKGAPAQQRDFYRREVAGISPADDRK